MTWKNLKPLGTRIASFLVAVLILAFTVSQLQAVPFVSKKTELEIGQGGDREVIEMYGLYQNKEIQLYVNDIGQSLVSKLADREFDKFFFKVVDSSEINAFALPGGYIYVTRGILAHMNSEAELANVLGHEIGHVIFHHGAKAMFRAIGSTILSIGAAVGGAAAGAGNAGQWLIVSSQLFNQINLGYGREAELESDVHGLINAYETGYNPLGMVDFFQTLRRQEIFTGQSYHAFAASHPETKDRILKAELFSTSLLKKKQPIADRREVFLSQIKGMPYGGKRNKKDRKQYKKKEYIDIYTVKENDTFTTIAETELGDETRDMEIAALNGKRTRAKLLPGELLKILRPEEEKKDRTLQVKPEKDSKPDGKRRRRSRP